MPESTSSPAPPHCTVATIRPRVDFVCHWRLAVDLWYTYRIPSHHLMLVDEGGLRARTPQGDVLARPGDLLWLPREARSEYGFAGANAFWEAHLSFAAPGQPELPLWLEGAPLPAVIALGVHAPAARAVFTTLCRELDRPGEVHQLRVQSAVYDLLAIIATALGRAAAPPARPDPWQRLRMQLARDLASELTLAELAAGMALSEDHLIRGFRKRFGTSPMAFRAESRLRWAASVLNQGECSVKEVAHRLGFRDASAFARAFRRQFGLAPSELWGGGVVGPLPEAPPGDEPYLLNRHIRPPGSTSVWFPWV